MRKTVMPTWRTLVGRRVVALVAYALVATVAISQHDTTQDFGDYPRAEASPASDLETAWNELQATLDGAQ